jgi:3-dehydroquinate dehydratase-2
MPKPHFLIINGPNLNLLGRRQPEIYGDRTFESFYEDLKAHFHKVIIAYYQSNHEGDIIDQLQHYGFRRDGFLLDGIILNAAAYTHTSIAIGDTLAAISTPVVEVHISDVYNREDYRKVNYLKAHVDHQIVGKGLAGYAEAIEWLLGYHMYDIS